MQGILKCTEKCCDFAASILAESKHKTKISLNNAPPEAHLADSHFNYDSHQCNIVAELMTFDAIVLHNCVVFAVDDASPAVHLQVLRDAIVPLGTGLRVPGREYCLQCPQFNSRTRWI